jgi:hypothetical protein
MYVKLKKSGRVAWVSEHNGAFLIDSGEAEEVQATHTDIRETATVKRNTEKRGVQDNDNTDRRTDHFGRG